MFGGHAQKCCERPERTWQRSGPTKERRHGTFPYFKRLPAVVRAGGALAGCQTLSSQIKASGSMGPSDAEFINAAYAIAQLDEQAGKLAATKATDPA